MNPVEIEEAVARLAETEFNPGEFAYEFLRAFGNKDTTIRRLQTGASNRSDIGGVLQAGHVHILTCKNGSVPSAMRALRDSKATKNPKNRVKFILATDGIVFEAEDQVGDVAPVVAEYKDLPDHFGFFLPLAGISTTQQVRESSFDIKATGRLNRLYVQLLKDNPDWGSPERRHDMNHFVARLIFCFFAEDTEIFDKTDQLTSTIETMSSPDGSDTHEIISRIFQAMNTPRSEREITDLPRWCNDFPYVNGGLFAGKIEVPIFSKIARSYLLHIGNLDWQKINPDIFGSMIQAVADDEERGSLGMHYTSVPNILKVLNPLFLDELRLQLSESKDSGRKLLNLRNRLSKIRVFDPACGSGNFLVIAYKELRKIEAEINRFRNEPDFRSVIPLTNFRGIEIRDFSAEVARLALIIAEYQCDVLYRGQVEALKDFLPLDSSNWIVTGNALALDWESVCPASGKSHRSFAVDMFQDPNALPEIDFENEGGETYICGNPPYKGTKGQSSEQKQDLLNVFEGYEGSFKVLDYVAGWFVKAAEYLAHSDGGVAFVSTNSVCQGNQVPVLWPLLTNLGVEISFAYTSFKWSNLAAHNAGVTVVVIGLEKSPKKKRLFITQGEQVTTVSDRNINAYLVPSKNIVVEKRSKPARGLSKMELGNQPYEGGFLIFEPDEISQLDLTSEETTGLVRKIVGSSEVINGSFRYCLWVEDQNLGKALQNDQIQGRINKVREWRLASQRPATQAMASRAHQFCEMKSARDSVIVVPIRSSENREYLPFEIFDNTYTVNNLAYAIYDGELFNAAILASRLHLVWISAVCGKLETRFSYSNKMGWNTFPVPSLSEKNISDLNSCLENILLEREAHFPSTIAELYDPEHMPRGLRSAHEANDEVLERIYIGRRFKNDTERLETLFEMYSKG